MTEILDIFLFLHVNYKKTRQNSNEINHFDGSAHSGGATNVRTCPLSAMQIIFLTETRQMTQINLTDFFWIFSTFCK